MWCHASAVLSFTFHANFVLCTILLLLSLAAAVKPNVSRGIPTNLLSGRIQNKHLYRGFVANDTCAKELKHTLLDQQDCTTLLLHAAPKQSAKKWKMFLNALVFMLKPPSFLHPQLTTPTSCASFCTSSGRCRCRSTEVYFTTGSTEPNITRALAPTIAHLKDRE